MFNPIHFRGGAEGKKGVEVTVNSRCNGRCRFRISDKRDAPAAKLEKVFCDDVSGPTVIDCDQVVSGAPRIGQDTTIEQHDRDASSLQLRNHTMVGLIASGNPLQGSKENASNLFGDVLLAELQRLLVFRPGV